MRPSGAEELVDGLPPDQLVIENARRKARAVAAAPDSEVKRLPVLGVDTEVTLGEDVLGKPTGPDHARATLRLLAGREHIVIAGLALIRSGAESTVVARTGVRFRDLTDAEIDAYVQTGEWRDRAGGYAIQGRGALLVSEIRGDYLNVVGLPVAALVRIAPDLF